MSKRLEPSLLKDSKSKRRKRDVEEPITKPQLTDLGSANISTIWKFKKFLGQGTFGTVVSGQRDGINKQIAMKTIQNRKRKSVKPDTDILREVWYLQQTKGNKFVCQIYDAFFAKEANAKTMTFIFMKLYDTSLDAYLRSPCRLADEDFKLAKNQLTLGLQSLHQLGILHRDFSSKNILVKLDPQTGKARRLVICDLGMSRQFPGASDDTEIYILPVDREPALSVNITTVTFRAPELLLGTCKYGWPIDCWSLGIVLYYVLTGKHPFDKSKKFGVNDKQTFNTIIWPRFLAQHRHHTQPPANLQELELCGGLFYQSQKNLNPNDNLAIQSLLCLSPTSRIKLAQFRTQFVE